MDHAIVYCGTPEFAAVSLRYLLEKDCNVIAVVTMPDRAQGRGRKIQFSPVKQLALDYEIPLFQPDKATDPDFLQQLESLKPDLVLVCAYGKILRRRFIDIPRYGCINLHASLLPRYRGPSPIQFAILNGDKETGVTTFMIDEGMDTGDIILERRITVSSDDTTGSLHDKLASAGAQVLYDTVRLCDTPPIPTYPQQGEAIITKKITPQMSVVDWSKPAGQIHNLIRAMNPVPGARTTLPASMGGRILKIFASQPADASCDAQPGKITHVEHDHFVVACGNGQLSIWNVQLEGKPRMTADKFLLGHQLIAGEMLGSPVV